MKAIAAKSEALDLYLMANLRPKVTGLPMVVWASERGHARHGPRLKVGLQHGPKLDPYRTVSVTVDEHPRVVDGELPAADLRVVREFIRLNLEILLSYWNGDAATDELLEGLKSVRAG